MTSGQDRPQECQARQWSDEMVCTACRLRWDMNDPEPPPCNPIKSDPMQPRENVRIFPRWRDKHWPRT